MTTRTNATHTGNLHVTSGGSDTVERVVGDCDVTIPVSGSVTITVDLWVSANAFGVYKYMVGQVRRDSVTGAVVTTHAFGYPAGDSNGGHDLEWSETFVDSSPTTGRYVLTLQATPNAADVYSDTHALTLSSVAQVTAPPMVLALTVPTPVVTAGATVTPDPMMLFLSMDVDTVSAYVIDRTAGVLTLTLDDTEIEDQPGSLHATVGNGTPSSTVWFFIDSVTTSVASAELDEAGTVIGVAIPVDGLSAGSHTVSVGSDDHTPGTAVSFTCDTDAATSTVPDEATPPDPTLGTWRFTASTWTDSSAIPTYEFASNPEQISEDRGELNLTVTPTTAPLGTMVVWEGAPRPGNWTFTGRVFTKFDHDALVWWAAYNGRVWLYDEFGRRTLIKIDSVKFTRKRNISAQWDQEYTMAVTVLQATSSAPMRWAL